MSILLDTNILLRSAEPIHPMHPAAVDAVAELRRQGEILCLVPQNFYEFWVVGTRPAAQNGLGLTPAEAQAELARLKVLFILLGETPAVFPHWEQLVTRYQVSGKAGHDAHLVAAMTVHGLTQILTFNVSDFQRYQGITPLDPYQVVASRPPGLCASVNPPINGWALIPYSACCSRGLQYRVNPPPPRTAPPDAPPPASRRRSVRPPPCRPGRSAAWSGRR